jgi:predicted TIM-barrel fold metal-dependent hydrolase
MARVISADSHVVEGPGVFAGLAERFGDEAPRIMDTDTETDAIVIPSRGAKGAGVGRMGLAGLRLRKGATLSRQPGRKPDVTDLTAPDVLEIINLGYAGLRPGLREGSRRTDDQDLDGLAAEFLYPGFFGMFSMEDPALTVALHRNYNDWIRDYAAEADGRLYGLAALPVQDPTAAAKELARVIDMGFRGACIPCTAPAAKPYHDADYSPIWALAQEAGIPLSMHVGTNSFVPTSLRPPRTTQDTLFGYATAQTSIQRTLADLICRGVAERYPRLRFVVSEFNAGWIAHFLERLAQGFARERRVGREMDMQHTPSEIWQRQFYATIEDDQPALLTRHLIGIDNLMWGCDYPHTDSTWPCSMAVLDEVMAELPPVDRDKITRINVAALYGLAEDGLAN